MVACLNSLSATWPRSQPNLSSFQGTAKFLHSVREPHLGPRHHAFKYGTEIRREEFTIFQPASPRGNLDFNNTFTDNPAVPGTGGSGFASFFVGLTDGGSINNLHNVDYFRPTYAFYGQDDWKVAPRLTLTLVSATSSSCRSPSAMIRLRPSTSRILSLQR